MCACQSCLIAIAIASSKSTSLALPECGYTRWLSSSSKLPTKVNQTSGTRRPAQMRLTSTPSERGYKKKRDAAFWQAPMHEAYRHACTRPHARAHVHTCARATHTRALTCACIHRPGHSCYHRQSTLVMCVLGSQRQPSLLHRGQRLIWGYRCDSAMPHATLRTSRCTLTNNGKAAWTMNQVR